SATDPLTGHEIPPPSGGRADEASGWFLDNFAPRELERHLAGGSEKLKWDVRRAAGVWLAVSLVTAYVAWCRIASNVDPGVVASLAVVASGVALTLFLFHLMRIEPARRLAQEAIPKSVIRAHLDDCRKGRI